MVVILPRDSFNGSLDDWLYTTVCKNKNVDIEYRTDDTFLE
jgi:hypothetical protein